MWLAVTLGSFTLAVQRVRKQCSWCPSPPPFSPPYPHFSFHHLAILYYAWLCYANSCLAQTCYTRLCHALPSCFLRFSSPSCHSFSLPFSTPLLYSTMQGCATLGAAWHIPDVCTTHPPLCSSGLRAWVQEKKGTISPGKISRNMHKCTRISLKWTCTYFMMIVFQGEIL